jgi:hypothetical protein
MLIGQLSSPSNGDDLTIDDVVQQPVDMRVMLASFALAARLANFLAEAAESRSKREHCVALLVSLGCHDEDKVLALLGKLPAMIPVLYAFIADGSP